jgi:hypothetical protein
LVQLVEHMRSRIWIRQLVGKVEPALGCDWSCKQLY